MVSRLHIAVSRRRDLDIEYLVLNLPDKAYYLTMKRITAFVAAILLAVITAAGADLKGVRMEINSTDGLFAKGSKATVKAYVDKGVDGKMKMWVLENGTRILEKDVKLTNKPRTVFEYDCDHSCGVQVYLKPAASESKDNTGIGFIVAPEEFRQGYPCPEDFKEFWDGELARMRSADPVAKLTEVPLKGEDAEKFVCYAVEVSMHEGHPARGYIAMPRNAAPGSLPILMFLHGAGVSKAHCRSSVKTVLSYAKRGPNGAIAADINAHGFLNDQPQKYYDDLEKGELKDYRLLAPTSKTGFYYRLMYLRDVRALDFLCTLPEWDSRHVLLIGSSQGGGQSCGVAGMDPRVGAVIPIVPGMTDEGAKMVRACGWTRHFRQMTDNPNVVNFYPYYDSCNFLKYTKARLRIEVGLIDETCAPEGMFAAFNGAASEDKVIVPCPFRRHSEPAKGSDNRERWLPIHKDRLAFIDRYFSE